MLDHTNWRILQSFVVLVATCTAGLAQGSPPYILETIVDPDPGNTVTWGEGIGAGPDLNSDGVPEVLIPKINGQFDVELHIYDVAHSQFLPTVTTLGTWVGTPWSLDVVPDLTSGNAGDVDADGVEDIYFSNPRFSAQDGAVWILSGATLATVHFIQRPVIPTAGVPNPVFGVYWGKLGDLNHDGHAEFAIGDIGPTQEYLDIYSGIDASILYSMQAQGIARVGDVNGDGFDDLALGQRSTGSRRGRIISGADGSLLWSMNWVCPHPGGISGTCAGSTSTAIPLRIDDVDGDGIDDVAFYTIGTNGVAAFSTGTGLILWSADLTATASNSAWLGYGFATTIGDLDGDGFVDIALPMDPGNPYSVNGPSYTANTVYSGFDGSHLQWAPPGPTGPHRETWQTVSSIGDLNGDGTEETVWSDPQGIVRLQSYRPITSSVQCPGIPNSTGLPAELISVGSRAVSAGDTLLWARHIPIGSFGYYLMSQNSGTAHQPGGSNGDLCLAGTGPIGRLIYTLQPANPAGFVAAGIDILNLPPPLSGPVQANETWNFQFWYRGGNSSNFSNSISIDFN